MISLVSLGIELLILFILNQSGYPVTSGYEAMIFISFFTVFFILMLFGTPRYARVCIPISVAYFFRLFLVLFDIYGRKIMTLPGSGGDTENFYKFAIRYARGEEIIDNPSYKTFGMMAKLFGENRLLLQFLLMLLSIASLLIVYRILNELQISRQAQLIAIWVMSILPYYSCICSVFLRETVVTFFATCSLFYFVKWLKNKGEVYLFLSFVFLIMGSIYHSGIIGFGIGYIIIRLLYNPETEKFQFSLRSIIYSIVIILAFAYLYSNYSSVLFGKFENIESLSDISNGSGQGGSSYAAIAGTSENIVSFVIFTPIRILMFLFTPLPFQIRGIKDIIAMFFSAWFYGIVYYRALKGIFQSSIKERNVAIVLLIIGLCTAFVFGWGSTNIGTNLRHRDKMISLYIILLALSYDSIPVKKRVYYG